MQVRFWSSLYHPELAFNTDPVCALVNGPDGGLFEVKKDDERYFRAPKGTDTCHDIGVWCAEHDYKISDTQLVDQRRRPYWQGKYIITFKKGATK